MPIHMRQNQYRGVNAHLHSHLQQHGGWEGFHAEHITHLREAIQRRLPEGYYVLTERSLQISAVDLTTGISLRSGTKPDLTVYHDPTYAPSERSAEVTSTPTLTLTVAETIVEPEYLTSVMIYRAQSEIQIGVPVTRIELLSPANKPPGTHHQQYIVKRKETLESHINLVEIDYLHERRSPVAALASYQGSEPNATPYVVLVSKPTPSLEEGPTYVFGFHIDDDIPTIPLPLTGDVEVPLSLDSVYQHTFESNTVYGLKLVDYDLLPEGFNTYSGFDQRRIWERMEAVRRDHSS